MQNLIIFIYIYFLKEIYSYHLPNNWNLISIKMKKIARNWFIDRAEKTGIPWTKMTDHYKDSEVFNKLIKYKNDITDEKIIYPNYYLKPFHSYENGNLNWKAAQENSAATLNIAAGYWESSDVYDAHEWMRKNTTNVIEEYIKKYKCNKPLKILDIGCSIGVSSEVLKNVFPNAIVNAIDLSPYFLSVAKYRSEKKELDINYFHMNAENINFIDNDYDLIVSSYLFHELPKIPTINIFKQVYKKLKGNGVFVIVDINTESIKNNALLSNFRKWAFEITEPHISSYYETNINDLLKDNSFINIESKMNDPINRIWICNKDYYDYDDYDKKKLIESSIVYINNNIYIDDYGISKGFQ